MAGDLEKLGGGYEGAGFAGFCIGLLALQWPVHLNIATAEGAGMQA